MFADFFARLRISSHAFSIAFVALKLRICSLLHLRLARWSPPAWVCPSQPSFWFTGKQLRSARDLAWLSAELQHACACATRCPARLSWWQNGPQLNSGERCKIFLSLGPALRELREAAAKFRPADSFQAAYLQACVTFVIASLLIRAPRSPQNAQRRPKSK